MRLKKYQFCYRGLLCVSMLMFIAGTAVAGPATTYKFKLQNIYVPGTTIETYAGPKFIELVDKLSGGRIKIENFAPGSLAPPTEILQAVGAGMFEMSASAGAYAAGTIPAAYLEFGVPGGPRTYGEFATFFRNTGYLELLREEYAKQNVYYIAPLIDEWYGMISKKPIRKLEDFKGMKIRATGLVAKMFAELGASPVFIPLSEVYTGLSMGTIDAMSFADPDSHWDMKLMEVAKYEIAPSIMVSSGNLIMNLKVWKSLPEDLQAIIEVAAWEISFRVFAATKVASYTALDKMKKDFGVELITLPPDQMEKWDAVNRKVLMEVAGKGPAAKKAVDMMIEWMSKNREYSNK
ncbi:MAG: hypothetical protein C4519_05865 [Desulfobacteraceae bacterium]|nr:MAG: hypothetical protein C4519_05865 [Desulfobacteraceae bacterium]